MIPRTAWISTDRGFATICASCPDREEAEARAKRAGLKLSHGTCDDCLPIVFGPEIAAQVIAERSSRRPTVDRPLSFFVTTDRENHGPDARKKEAE